MADTEQLRRDEELVLAMFALLQQDTSTHLQQQVQRFLLHDTTIFGLSDAIVAALIGAHMQATHLGRRLAGAAAPIGGSDEQFARTVVAGQYAYIVGLVNDIQNGKYPLNADGSLPDALVRRLGMYAGRLRGTANEAWGLALPDGTLFLWILGTVENHCGVCPERAAESAVTPYTVETIPGWPGDCSTPCLTSCDCLVETTTGTRGF